MIPFAKATLSKFKAAVTARGVDWREMERALSQSRAFVEHHLNIVAFTAGFVFDSLTLDRIDAWVDLAIQGLYLACLTTLITLQYRAAQGRWTAPERFSALWKYNEEILHFLFGGLLSAYVIFYSKSGVSSQTIVYFAFIGGLLVYNELPEARRWGASLRLALFTFCLASFMIYFVPVVVGKIGDGVFALSIAATILLIGALLAWMTHRDASRREHLLKLSLPAFAVLSALSLFYIQRWIPPVPLSLQFSGIYHKVERRNSEFILTYEKGPWYAFLKKQDNPFRARPGDRVHAFVRIFAPTRFSHDVSLHWLVLDDGSGEWVSRDRIALPIRGGRGQGWRGYAYKERWTPGDWKIRVETEDGRVMGETRFRIIADKSTKERRWKSATM